MRCYFADSAWIESVLTPFKSAVSIFGSVVFFLALLIMSSKFYFAKKDSYVALNCAMVFFLLSFHLFGQVAGLFGMSNTATVFTVLWIAEKYADIHISSHWNGWVLVFILSVTTWRCALWLHLHPDFVVSLFEVIE